jgi:hypothetical protein
MTTVINTISNKFNNLITLMSSNISILQQFYINKKINNIYNTNLNDIISNITNNIIEINTLLKTSSFFEYYPLIFPRIDDLRTYINKVIISIFISILEEKVVNYRSLATMPNINNDDIVVNSIYDLTTPYNQNKDIQFIINNEFKLQSVNVLTFEGNSLDIENIYRINFIFRYITFKINRIINMFNFIIKTFYKIPSS